MQYLCLPLAFLGCDLAAGFVLAPAPRFTSAWVKVGSYLDDLGGGPPDPAPSPTPSLVAEAADLDDMTTFFNGHPNQLSLFSAIVREGAPAAPYLKSLEPALGAGSASRAAEILMQDGPKDGHGPEDDPMLVEVVDFLQDNLLKTGDVEGDPEFDAKFIAEGRKLLAVQRFAMSDAQSDMYMLEKLWDEIGAIVQKGTPQMGTIVMAPKYSGGDVKALLDRQISPALTWLGLENDLDLEGFRRAQGAPCPLVRVLFRVETDAIEDLFDDDSAEAMVTQADSTGSELFDIIPAAEEPVAGLSKAEVDAYISSVKAEVDAIAKARVEAPVAEPASEETAEDGPVTLQDLLMTRVNSERLRKMLGDF